MINMETIKDKFCEDQKLEDGTIWCISKLLEGHSCCCPYKREDLTRPYNNDKIAPQIKNTKGGDGVCQDFNINNLIGRLPFSISDRNYKGD